MSASFNTVIHIKAKSDEITEMLKVIRYYEKDMRDRYASKHDCGYLDDSQFKDLSDEELETMTDRYPEGIDLELSGPYGSFGNIEEFDLFERLADAAPNAYFIGYIDGFDPGGEQTMRGILEDKVLTLRYSYDNEFLEMEPDEYEEFSHDDLDLPDAPGSGWNVPDSIYDPVKKEYKKTGGLDKYYDEEDEDDDEDEEEADNSWISGMAFVTTGLSEKDEEKVKEIVEENEGVIKSGISKKVNFLIYNPNYDHETVKMKKAKELIAGGLKIGLITTGDFFEKTGYVSDDEYDEEDE